MTEVKIKYIPVIDSLRGIAALSVVLFHFVCKTIGFIKNELVLKVFENGHYGVQMFFVISGVVIPMAMLNGGYKHSSWKNFILKRFIRIEPPYLFAVLIGIIYLTVRNFIPSSSSLNLAPTLKEILLHIGYLIPFFEDTRWINPVFWTLAIEFQYYIAMCIIFPFLFSKNVISRTLSYIILGLISYVGHNYSTDAFFINWITLFMSGIVWVLYKSKTSSLLEFTIVEIICLYFTYTELGSMSFYISVITLLMISFLPNLRNTASKFLGDISYSLYLIHSIIGAAFINFCSHLVTLPIMKLLVILSGITISISSSYIMYLFIEKPSKDWAKKVKY